MEKLAVTIWDSSAARIIEIEKNLQLAAREQGMELSIAVMSEIPLLSRRNLLSRIPALEIDGMLWTLRPHESFTLDECRTLLRRLSRSAAKD